MLVRCPAAAGGADPTPMLGPVGRPGDDRAVEGLGRRSGRTSTPATVVLDRVGIDYRTVDYDARGVADDRDGGMGDTMGERVASQLRVDPAAMFKTLIIEVDGSPMVAVVPVDHTLDLKAFARSAGGKRAHLAEPRDAERLTGYVVGGISPIGQRRTLPTFVDESALGQESLMVNAGKRGTMLELSPDDLLAVTDGTVVPLARA